MCSESSFVERMKARVAEAFVALLRMYKNQKRIP